VLGAFVVAVFFLILDIAAGRPLATPSALGAVLFLGEPFDLSRPLDPVMIAGYTAIHGTVFIAFASIAAVLLLSIGVRPRSDSQRAGVIVVALFLAATGIFYVFSQVSGISALDGWRVLVANLLAALAMAGPLARLQPRDWRAGEPPLLVGADGLEPPTPSV
jgi:hypothetical protein